MRVPRKVSSTGTQVLCEKRPTSHQISSLVYVLSDMGRWQRNIRPAKCLLYVKQHTPRTARCTNDPENRKQRFVLCSQDITVEIAAYISIWE